MQTCPKYKLTPPFIVYCTIQFMLVALDHRLNVIECVPDSAGNDPGQQMVWMKEDSPHLHLFLFCFVLLCFAFSSLHFFCNLCHGLDCLRPFGLIRSCSQYHIVFYAFVLMCDIEIKFDMIWYESFKSQRLKRYKVPCATPAGSSDECHPSRKVSAH